MVESILLSRSQVNFLFLLTWTHVHERFEACELVEFEITECFVSLHTTQVVLSEGSTWDDLALTLDGADNVAESILLCETVCR